MVDLVAIKSEKIILPKWDYNKATDDYVRDGHRKCDAGRTIKEQSIFTNHFSKFFAIKSAQFVDEAISSSGNLVFLEPFFQRLDQLWAWLPIQDYRTWKLEEDGTLVNKALKSKV